MLYLQCTVRAIFCNWCDNEMQLFLLIRESVMQLVSEALKHPVKQTVEENFEEKVSVC